MNAEQSICSNENMKNKFDYVMVHRRIASDDIKKTIQWFSKACWYSITKKLMINYLIIAAKYTIFDKMPSINQIQQKIWWFGNFDCSIFDWKMIDQTLSKKLDHFRKD